MRPDNVPEPADVDPETIIARVRAAGVVGMGGGGFPSAEKLEIACRCGVDTIIGNAMATEPDGLGDHHLLRHEQSRVRDGLGYARAATGAETAFIATPKKIDMPDTQVVDAPFPAGEERCLVSAATGRTVDRDQKPTDVGVVVFNVATLAAIADAVEGRPAEGRYIGVDGHAQYVRYGTPISTFNLGQRVRVGGFSGHTRDDAEIVKPTTISVGPVLEASECIRCGWCVPRCPVSLRPDALHEHHVQADVAASVIDCIECGACNAACPSRIDLVDEFRSMKARYRRQEEREREALKAKTRVAAREERLAHRHLTEEAERRTRRDRRRATKRPWQPNDTGSKPLSTQDPKAPG